MKPEKDYRTPISLTLPLSLVQRLREETERVGVPQNHLVEEALRRFFDEIKAQG